MLDIDWSIISSSFPSLMKGMGMTLQITFTAMAFGIFWGTILAVFRISSVTVLRLFSKFYVNCFRSIPLYMVLLWFYLIVPQLLSSVLGLSPSSDIRLTSAMVAFSLFEAAYYSEIIRAGLKSISRGQTYAALALGMTKGQALRLVLLPQAFRVMTPLLLTQGIILFQDTALVHILGLTDFFSTALNIGGATGQEVEMVVFVGIIYFIICFSTSLLVSYFKKRTAI